MDERLAERIKDHVLFTQKRPIPFPPASDHDIDVAEAGLGFGVPETLKLLYLKIGNGGFGPGRGGTLIGLNGGYESDLGTIVAAYEQIKEGAEYDGLNWWPGLLPFCEWGSNIFSCVDCNDTGLRAYVSEACEMRRQNYTLDDFMQMWIGGIDILCQEERPLQTIEGINPFTGKKIQLKIPKKNRSEG